MADQITTVLDHIDGISVPGNVFAKTANEFWALVCLRDGMEFLYRQGRHHWYAISACQYVRLVGAIAYKHDNGRPKATEYAKRIIPEVVAFRDKVAAHFAWSTQNSRDNDAERLASIIPLLTFCIDTWTVGAFNVTGFSVVSTLLRIRVTAYVSLLGRRRASHIIMLAILRC